MIDDAAHIIQVALTPVFLLSAIAALLSVFSTRLGRVADRIHVVSDQVTELRVPETAGRPDQIRAARLAGQLDHLRRRSWHLDVAVVTGAVAAALTCLVILLIFFGSLGNATVQAMLFGLFGLAVVTTLVSIVAFAAEMLLAGRGARQVAEERQATATVRSVRPAGPPIPLHGQAPPSQAPVPGDG